MAEIREFWDTFVAGAVQDWRDNPRDVRRATIALIELDNVVERLIQHQNPSISRGDISRERDRLGRLNQQLEIARDVHDTHKHGRLTRQTAKIRGGQQLRTTEAVGISSAPIGDSSISGGLSDLWIERDADRHLASPVIEQCLTYLESELNRLGL
jgi:hypothetical protein